ncbi:MAG: S41 family peptidase [Piscinibacter sp.]
MTRSMNRKCGHLLASPVMVRTSRPTRASTCRTSPPDPSGWPSQRPAAAAASVMRQMRRWLGAALATVASTAAVAGAPALTAADWQADFDSLLNGLAVNYANFEDQIRERRLDLPALAARQRQALTEADDDHGRRAAIQGLLRQLRDPHVRVDWAPAAHEASEAVCAAGGDGGREGRVQWSRWPAFTPLTDDRARMFSAGLLRRPDGRRLGIVRLGLFVESAYPAACAEAARTLGLAADAPCDASCIERRDAAAARVLDAALVSTVRALRAAGAAMLVIDLSDNDGGGDWNEAVARRLAGPLRSARVAMLRHPAWQEWVDERLRKLGPDAPEAAAWRQARGQLAQPCDLSAAWTDRELATGARPLPCSTLVHSPLHALGTAEPRGPAVPPGINRLPLVLLVNEETHSAAEQFAALLRDHRKARVVGGVTPGAACGTFTSRGTSFTLPRSGALVHVPDCVRLRADGSNERRGITPDVMVPWAPSDSPWLRTVKAARTLERLR